MTAAEAVQRKPARSEGDRRPPLMIELGVKFWANVPVEVLEAWMTREYPEETRVMACIVRHSWAWPYESAHCVHDVDGRRQPMRQADIAAKLGMARQNVNATIAALVRRGAVRVEGPAAAMLICPCPRPEPQPGRPPMRAGEHGEPEDPELRRWLGVIQSNYRTVLAVIRSAYAQALSVIRSNDAYKEREKHRELQESVGAPASLEQTVLRFLTRRLTDSPSPEQERRIRELEAENARLRQQLERASQTTHGKGRNGQDLVEQLLKTYEPRYTRPWKPEDVQRVRQELEAGAVAMLRAYAEQRQAAGLEITNPGIFEHLARDCRQQLERSNEAKPARGPSRSSRIDQLAEEYARRKRAERVAAT